MFKRRETKDKSVDYTFDSFDKHFLGISHMHGLLKRKKVSFRCVQPDVGLKCEGFKELTLTSITNLGVW